MSGPLPKVNRVRRNRPTFDWVDLPAEGRKGRTPPFPLDADSLDEVAVTRLRTWWAAVWHSPAAAAWIDSDRWLLVELAYLKAAFEVHPKASLAAEIRHRTDQLGLTPKGRQTLRWRVVETAEEAPRSLRRFSHIRVVDDEDA